MKEHVVNPLKKTAAPFYGSCNYVTSVFLSAGSSIEVPLGGTKNVFPYCGWNVGGNSADYGAVLQPDGGNQISISPQYGYTRTISGLNLGQRNMLLSSQVPTSSDPCGDPVFMQASPTPQAEVTCVVPTGEITSSSGWADGEGEPAAHKFTQRLTPTSTSFASRQVTESDASPATDSCWFPGSFVPKATGVSGGTWIVGSDNRWGPDYVGWQIGAFAYYQQNRPAMGLSLPCEFNVFQRLSITCGTELPTVYRSLVLLRGIISATGASSERDGVLVGRPLIVSVRSFLMPNLLTRRQALKFLVAGAASTSAWAQRTSPAGEIEVRGRRATFSVDYVRPLESVVWTFIEKYGWRITYEEAPIEYSGDMVDVTRNAAAGVRVFFPRGGRLEFSYDLGPGGAPPENPRAALETALAVYNSSGLPGRYALIESDPYWHVIPIARANSAGNLEDASSPFDIEVNLAERERSHKEAFDELIKTVEAASGFGILVAWSPFGRGDQPLIQRGFEQTKARAVLRGLLDHLGGARVWTLLNDPGRQRYGFGIRML